MSTSTEDTATTPGACCTPAPETKPTQAMGIPLVETTPTTCCATTDEKSTCCS